jgi:hypothetical protein
VKVYSDTLTIEDLRAALPPNVGMDATPIRHPRKRARGWTVRLSGHGPLHNRRRNTGTHGAEDGFSEAWEKAATYDDHGRWMAPLFDKDPDAVISWWNGREAFETGTNGAYSTRKEVRHA